MSYLSEPMPKSCRANYDVNADKHNDKIMQQELGALRDRNAVGLKIDRFS